MREGRKYILLEIENSGILFELPVVQGNANGLVVAAVQEEDEWDNDAEWAAELTIGMQRAEEGTISAGDVAPVVAALFADDT